MLRLAWTAGMDRLFDPLLLPDSYLEACKTAGVRIFKRPVPPARSVLLSYKPRPPSYGFRRFEFDAAGRLVRSGSSSWQPRLEDQLELFEIESVHGAKRPDLAIVRYRQGEKTVSVASPSADFRVTDHLTGEAEFDNALWKQGIVIHRLQVTDARNGERLAEMDYVVDMSRNRGCGQNVKNAIDVDAFVLDALGVPIQIPDWEQKRRERAGEK